MHSKVEREQEGDAPLHALKFGHISQHTHHASLVIYFNFEAYVFTLPAKAFWFILSHVLCKSRPPQSTSYFQLFTIPYDTNQYLQHIF